MSGMSGQRSRTVAIAVVLALALGGCVDQGFPSTEEQLKTLGLPLDTALQVDAKTEVSMRLVDGVPELLIFVPVPFGGSQMNAWPGQRPTVNGGMVGDASSQGLQTDAGRGPANRYLFGAGQGPIGRIVADAPEARTQIVNAGIDGWVIVVPETIGTYTLHWQLLGPDGQVVFESVDVGVPDRGMKVDKDTRALVPVRDGVPQLLVYTPNAFGGAQLAVWPADHPTVNGGLVGTATSPGHRYLFGAGQGPLKSGVGVRVYGPDAQAEIVNGVDGGWVIAVPETVAIDDVEWRLISPDGKTMYEGVGLGPRQP